MAKKSPKSLDYYHLIVEINLIFLIISVPWFIDLRLSGVMIGKLAVMQFFSGVILLTWLVKFFFSPQIKFFRSKFDLPFLFFLLISLAATVFSKNPYLSLVGAYYRYEGLITFINYLFLFYVAVNFLNEEAIWRILKASVFTGGLIGFYGLMQHLNRDLVGWGAYDTQRVFSTFGNPVYLGAYTATLLPLALAMCLQEFKSQKKIPIKIKKIRERIEQLWTAVSIKITPWFYNLSLALILSGLCLSRGRGAMIGFVVSMVVFFCLYFKTREIFSLKKVILSLAILLLVGGYFNLNPETSAIGRLLQMVNREENKDRISSAGTGEKAFTSSVRAAAGARPIMWRDALKIIKDYPLLGVGPETFGLVYPKYRSLDLILTEGGQYGRPDRVHNDILDLTLAKGVLGLGAYVWFLFIYFWLSFKGTLSSKYKLINIGLLGAGVGYFIQNQSCFWIIPSTSIFFILAGLVARLNTPPTSYFLLPKLPKGIKLIICLVIIIPIMAVGRLTSNFYLADLEFKQGYNLYWGGAVIEAIPRFEKALLLNPRERQYFEYILHAYLDTATLKEHVKKAIEVGEKATKLYPQDTIFHNLLGVAYSNDGQLDKTIVEYQKVLEFDPLFSDVRGKLGSLYVNRNEYDKAIEIYKEGLQVNPECSVSLDNLAKIYLLQGKTKKAKTVLKRLVKINPDNFEAHHNLARIYYEEGDLSAVVNECKEMLRIDPKNVETHKNLGSIYFKQRLFSQAYLEFTKVLELDPQNTYAKNILAMIGVKK